ncbi:hypothetical protein Tco_0223490, partial [Tanacetum coccineum]
ELQSLMEVIPDEEEVAIDDVPLAIKSPSIVGWKIHKEGKKSYYQIMRADGKSQMYRIFSHMLKSFSMEDLEDLYKLVKAKYESTRPVEDLDLVLWNDLKTMFEPHVEDEIWKLQQRYKVLSWKLFDSCGVHCLSLQSGMIYMLVEKRYPLTPPTITDMLNKKLQGRIVGIKSLLNAASITAAHIRVNAAQLFNAAEGVNAASEEVSTAELVSTAYLLLEAVEKRFGGNATTKKTQRNLLKHQYENFTAPSSEMLDQTFDRLQKLVSQLELLDEKLSQEDVNQKLLRSLSPEWNTHAIVDEE